MVLKDRLAELRRQAGRVEPAPMARNDIAQRLQRLRPGQALLPGRGADVTRCGSTRVDSGQRDARLAERLEGEVLAPGLILIQRRLALTEWHGARALHSLNDVSEHLPEAAGWAPGELVFLDTETSGLSGGAGTTVFMLGLARLEPKALVVHQYVLSAFSGEAAMLQAAGKWMRETDRLVTYNGKSFDVPLLATRCRLAGVNDPFSEHAHLDLLHPTRRAFARIWDDCRLPTVEGRLLDFHRNNDLPGSQAPAAWLEFVQSDEPGRLPDVARHNYWDLVSLAVLLPTISEVYSDPATWGADIVRVARAQLKHGNEARALALLEDQRDQLDEEALLELARLLRRAGAWTEARSVWESLAARGSVEALTHLAKYHEHVRQDPSVALHYCRALPSDVAARRRHGRLSAKLALRASQTDCFD